MSFPPATEMFQFTGFASHTYGFSRRSPKRVGLPHSEIHGSKGARPSPRLFAACHVLHRLSVPRHPPDALQTLDHSFSSYSTRHPQGQSPDGRYPKGDGRTALKTLIFRAKLPRAITLKASSRKTLGSQNIHNIKQPRTRKTGSRRNLPHPNSYFSPIFSPDP